VPPTRTNPLLKALFSSETRIRILAHFFRNPGRSFYVRQLEQLLEIPVGQLRRELVKLESAGLFRTHREGNQKRYALDPGIPIHEELRGLFLKTAGLADLIRQALSGHPGIELAFLYGSFARGEERDQSDVDLMVVGDSPEQDLNPSVALLEREIRRAVNYSVYPRAEVVERLEKRDDFIITVFTEPRILIIGSESDELFQAGG